MSEERRALLREITGHASCRTNRAPHDADLLVDLGDESAAEHPIDALWATSKRKHVGQQVGCEILVAAVAPQRGDLAQFDIKPVMSCLDLKPA